jgi:alpha-mannosidase
MRRAILRSVVGLCALSLQLVCGAPRVAAAPQAPDRKPIFDRLESITVVPLPEWRFHSADGVDRAVPAEDDSAWQTIHVKDTWKTGSAWLRQRVEIPAGLNGYNIRGARLRLRFSASGDYPTLMTAYVNGVRVAEGEDLGVPVVASDAQPGTLVIAVKIQIPPGSTTLDQAQLEIEPAAGRPDPRMLLEECRAAETIIPARPEGQAEHAAILDAALAAIDWGALSGGNQAAFDRSLRAAQEKLQALNPWLKQFSIHATGNSHIDMAWLWPWTETVEVVRNTFTSVLELMQEFPEFTFTMSSVRTYDWMEEKYPALFEQIRQRVREGRWEPIGAMWVEPDLNMPDGESIVRQLLVGKRYFQKEFGVDVRTGWNPDSFGYNWQLPQIYKKSGMDFFVTQKIAWGDTTHFPYSLFWWEAPDGSRVLTYFPHDYVNGIEPQKMARDLADFEKKTGGFPDMMHLYGVGDHGGGPTRSMLEAARHWQDPSAVFPRLSLGPAQPYLDAVAAKVSGMKIPVWKDELYLEYHRGVYTSQAETKKNNRRNEALLLETEKFSALSSLFGGTYPQKQLNDAWKKVLFNQFHDVLSGSGIHAVYVDAMRDHEEVRRAGHEMLQDSLAELAAHARTAGPGVPVVLFNPLSWARTDVVEVEAQFSGPVAALEVRGPSGAPALAEIVSNDAETHRLLVRFLAEDVPPLGYSVFHLLPVSKAPRVPSTLVAGADTIENEFLRVRVDAKTGCITSLLDKKHNVEALAAGACGNLLQAFVDKPKDYDAWNIDANFEDKKWDLTQAEEVKLVESGPVRAVLRVVKKFQNSTFTQDITLYPHVPRVDVRTTADWHERHILLKAAFPLAVRSDTATFEIPFGSIERPTTRRTPAEKAKFEVPALRWADLSDSQNGFSLLNDSKYGYDAHDNVLRLSLLRSPTWPDPEADQGLHHFTYSLYPHGGTWREAGTVRRGYELNVPLLAFVTTPHSGTLPASYSFAALEPENLVLTAVKKAEDDDALIFRFYEFAGRQTEAHLKLPPGATQAAETNLMEVPQHDLALHDSEAVLPTGPYEIKCIKVTFGTHRTGEKK